jgi:two-component system, chemotaxis family, CheB/CheR fusion protein
MVFSLYLVTNIKCPYSLDTPLERAMKIRFYIEDTGNGIPEAKMTDIFLPFYQLDPPQSSQEGTGLGLTISQNLVEQMGSQIQVQSRLAEGSIFWFDLDLAAIDRDRDPASFAGQIEPNIVGYTGRKRQILVVDDLDNNREVLVNFLSPLGFNVLEANSGVKAIALTQEYQPDLIILDLVMPNMDGWEVTQRLRQESKFSELPVIIVSASIFPTDQSNCYQAGANHFLTKPLDFAKLLRVMEQYLELEWINAQGSQQCLQPASRSQLVYLV